MLVVALVGAAVALVNMHKTVTLSVDGASQRTSGFFGTVSEVLDSEGVTVGKHDVVAPSPDAKIEEGATVVVRYGRQLTLDVDGTERTVWTTARSVDEALDQIGMRLDGAYLSASRSMPLGRAGLELDVRTLKHVTFLADGDRHEVDTTAATLLGALEQAKLTVSERDRVSVDLTTPPQPDQVVTITRVTDKTSVDEKSVPFATERRDTSDLYKGQAKVLEAGKVGVRTLTYADTYTDGKLTTHKLVSDVVTKAPQTRVVLVGTKARPVPTVSSRTYGSVSGVASLNWAALARCESGGNPKAVNPAGYYGLYQFSLSTWRSVGGSGLPTAASPSEQTYRAQLLYKRSGAGQWPVCGPKLFS